MKKTLSLLTSLILLATLALSCVPAFAEELNLTVYYGATLEQMSPVLEAFQAKYPNINVKSYRAANEELAATMEMEVRSGNPQFDVIIQGNSPVMTLQRKYECFQPFTCDSMDAIQQSLTWRQFLSVLERKGYEVRMGRKYPVLRPPGKERFVRFKTLGKRYTPEAIQTRILYPRSYRPYVENPPTIKHGRLRSGKKPCRKLTGLRALYYRYLYELGALPRKPRRPSYAVRQDAYKLDQRIRQMEFLSRNNIDTLAQLEAYRQTKLGEIVQLMAERKSLYKTNPDSSRIQQINAALKQLRQEERLCRKIAEHSIEVQQHLTEARRDRAEQQQREQERAHDRRPNIDLTL